jgi:hypothetical protein
MRTSISKPLIFVVISVLVITYVSSTTFIVFAVFKDDNFDSGSCGAKTTNPATGTQQQTCCWTEEERVPGKLPPLNKVKVNYCQTCFDDGDCRGKVRQFGPPLPSELPTLEVPPNRTLPGGDIPALETVPREGLGNILPGEGFVQQPSAQPASIIEEELPQCAEGFELDEETGLCVPEQPEAAEEEPEQQSSEEEEGSEDSSNNEDNN